jgi:membrane associated rhomboid family serine protease
MKNSTAIIMLIVIFLIFVYATFKFKQENKKRVDTSNVPIFIGAIICFISGPFIGYFLSKYILPPDLWNNSDMGRNFDLAFLGSLFGLIFGALGAVVYYGWTEKNKSNKIV